MRSLNVTFIAHDDMCSKSDILVLGGESTRGAGGVWFAAIG
ncbi:Hypothetical protein RY67_1887 [Bifidobacterium longum subsp. infantis]|uniref:Uncharacterized protein n=1 Tax=Bifidobacterium longum subsp. infantis TaxID=1682 RepID=A0A0M3T6M7_BIFLI|nr:Hypothetical protein RY67_1887 [Bifidobacterium longum subsp. infantis]